ncbi:MAG: oxidoreductase [Rhodoglobus sp.]|nr:oxidoreductase [Rhodoglobus sp.]
MKRWLDRMTGLLTMYKLVLFVLIAVGVNALVLSLLGQIFYDPLSLLVSALVALVFTTASGWIAAKIARVEPHLVSSFITGLLVFFVMQPKLDLLGLSGIAIAGTVAGASKYLLAVRGRHVFNPAALGAIVPTLIVFTTFIGMSFGVWWVGTPALQPIIILGAFLVLYRTQRLIVGVTFVVLAALLATTVAITGGQEPGAAIQQVLLQSPILFFAGFMFSEPLTLPPRRWQQLVEALVVALLFTVPLPIGPVSNSPLFALLVGNLLAFFFGQRRGIRLAYLGKRQLGATTWELSFQPARPVRFLPGQYMELTIPHRKADFRGSRRYFSISSAPDSDGPITFAITVPSKSSSFKQALLDLSPGAIVNGTGVGGDFALPRDASEPLLLVAGGIGITPFASQLAHATERGEKRNVVVVYATSTPGPLPYADLLEKSGARVVLFGPSPKQLPAGWEYGGEGRVTGERLAAAVPDAARRRAFVSGPPALVTDLRKALHSQGARRVHSDYFSGY